MGTRQCWSDLTNESLLSSAREIAHLLADGTWDDDLEFQTWMQEHVYLIHAEIDARKDETWRS